MRGKQLDGVTWMSVQIMRIANAQSDLASRSRPPSPLLGKLRPGRTPEAVYEWLAAPGRGRLWWSKDMIVQGTKATPKAVDWALLFLRSLGALEVTEDPRCGRYHRYRLAPGATVRRFRRADEVE